MDRLTKIIKTHNWWLAEGSGSWQLLFLPFRGWLQMASRFTNLPPREPVFVFCKQGLFYQFLTIETSINYIKYLIEQDQRDNNFVKDKIKAWQEDERNLNQLIQEFKKVELSQLTNKQLWSWYNQLMRATVRVWNIPAILEGGGLYFDKVIVPSVAELNLQLSPEKLNDLLVTLTTPIKSSFAQKEYLSQLALAIEAKQHRGYTKLALGQLKDVDLNLHRKIIKHQQTYFWVRNNYNDVTPISASTFWKEIKSLASSKSLQQLKIEFSNLKNNIQVKKAKSAIHSKFKLNPDLKHQIKLFEVFTWWMDERKRINLISSHYFALVLNELSQRLGWDKQWTFTLFTEEIKEYLLLGMKPDLAKVKRRYNFVGHYNDKSSQKFEKIIEVKDKQYFKLLHSQVMGADKEIKGKVACKGGIKKIIGRVRIINHAKSEKFMKGEILVTSMTRPEFVPLMKKAKAIITNEGGITSHAAIVSRELNVPCIIGTQIATQVLKDGDEVEVDADNGIVKIVQKK